MVKWGLQQPEQRRSDKVLRVEEQWENIQCRVFLQQKESKVLVDYKKKCKMNPSSCGFIYYDGSRSSPKLT